jgi:hypothetical protein
MISAELQCFSASLKEKKSNQIFVKKLILAILLGSHDEH